MPRRMKMMLRRLAMRFLYNLLAFTPSFETIMRGLFLWCVSLSRKGFGVYDDSMVFFAAVWQSKMRRGVHGSVLAKSSTFYMKRAPRLSGSRVCRCALIHVQYFVNYISGTAETRSETFTLSHNDWYYELRQRTVGHRRGELMATIPGC